MTKFINVISTQDVTIFPDAMIQLKVELTESLLGGSYVILSDAPHVPKGLRVSNPTEFTKKFDVSVANFGDGPYWDGFIGDLDGNVLDHNDEMLPKGFFGKDERYSIPYDIKKGDVIATAEVIQNYTQTKGGEDNE